MITPREKFNTFFGTAITEKDWNENAPFVCDEYQSIDELEANDMNFSEMAYAKTAVYDADTQLYVIFNEVNYNWHNKSIIHWD